MLVHPNFDPVAISLAGRDPVVRDHVPCRLRDILWSRAPAHRARDVGRVTVAALDDLLFFCVLGVVLGGRLGYVLFYKPAYYFSHPLEIFAVWQGAWPSTEVSSAWCLRSHGSRESTACAGSSSWISLRPSPRLRSQRAGSQFHQRRASRPRHRRALGMLFRGRGRCRATLRSSTSSPSRGCSCS